MSMMSHDAANFQTASALPGRLLAPALPAFDLSSEGYAFETALCLVESQSPLLRPVLAPAARESSHMFEAYETHVLAERARLLYRLLASVRGCLEAREWLELLEAADRVSGELDAAIAESVARGERKRAHRRG